MSNNVIPNFLPPPYDFTTKEDEETEEEDDTEEEENENTHKGLCACKIFCGIIFALVVYRLIGPEIKIDLKVSINQNKSPQCTCKMT